MWNVCWQCGLYRGDKHIDPSGPYAVCPECGYKHPFRQQPLFLIGGASGSGKTAVCQELLGKLPEVVMLDSDILWRAEYDKPEEKYRDFFETWLRMCKNIGQAGRPVVLLGGGMGVPENLESCIERRYFSTLHYLALVCDDEVLAERLRQRPAWRRAGQPEFIAAHVKFNQWFKTQAVHGNPKVELINTSDAGMSKTSEQVAEWILSRLETK
jgi:shikimate kinase